MAVLGNARRRLARLISPDTNLFNSAFFSFLGSGYTNYDEDAKTYIEKGYAYNPDVYAVVKQQYLKHASIPREIKKVDDEQAKRDLDRLNQLTKGTLSPQQHIKKIKLQKKAYKDDYLPWPLEKPNPLQSWTEHQMLEKLFLATTGNVFYYEPFPENGINKGTPIWSYILPSHMVQIVLKDGVDKMNLYDEEDPVGYYWLVEGNKYVEFPAEQIRHVKYTNPLYDQEGTQLYGLSPLQAVLRNIESSNLAIDNNKKSMNNAGAFGFIHGKSQTLTSDQAKELKERMQEMDANPERLSKIAGVSAEIGFTRLSLTTDELKPFEYLKYDQQAICNVLGWSTVMLNTEAKGDYGGTITAEQKRCITGNIMPDNALLNQSWQEGFVKKFRGYENTVVESIYDDLPEMQDDQKTLMEWIEKAINIGVMTRNEGREALKLVRSEDENMDIVTVKDDVIPLSEAILDNFNESPSV